MLLKISTITVTQTMYCMQSFFQNICTEIANINIDLIRPSGTLQYNYVLRYKTRDLVVGSVLN